MEFFPDVHFIIPKYMAGGCCVKAVPEQTEESRRMYLFAQLVRGDYKEEMELVVPSKVNTKAYGKIKWKKFLAGRRIAKMKINMLPALALDGKVLCQGCLGDEKQLEKKIKRMMRRKV